MKFTQQTKAFERGSNLVSTQRWFSRHKRQSSTRNALETREGGKTRRPRGCWLGSAPTSRPRCRCCSAIDSDVALPLGSRERLGVSRFANETTHHPRRPGVSPVADDSCRFVARLDAKNGHRRALESERSRILFLSRIASIEEKENGSGLASERRFGTLWGV